MGGPTPFAIPDPAVDPEHARSFCERLYESSGAESRVEFDTWLEGIGYAGAARRMQDMHWLDNRRVGLFCMAGNPAHPLMWSHYASGHRGFCWIIDHRRAPFIHAAKVDYLPDLPSIDWARWKEQNLVKLSLLTKASFWEHEDEYRIVLPRTEAPQHFTSVPHNGKGEAPIGRYLQVDPETIIGVIFGAGMKKEHRRAIAKLAAQYRSDFEFNAAGLHRRQYRMALRSIEGADLRELLGKSS